MLTRIEIDGFKTFEQFALDLKPFLLILGPNASGKSNLFDALQLLSRLAGGDLRSAVCRLRGGPHEIFRRAPDGSSATRIRLVAEVLLNPTVRDAWGASAEIAHSRLRYEVEIARRDANGGERLFVEREEVRPIAPDADDWGNSLSGSGAFRRRFLRYSRKDPFLTTEMGGQTPAFHVREGGQTRTHSAEMAGATVLSSISSTEFPHLFALGDELREIRLLQLDPVTIRRPGGTLDSERLHADGSNLAAVLARLQTETRSESQPQGILADISRDLSTLVPAIRQVRAVQENSTRDYRIEADLHGQTTFNAQVLSDGTLRMLALLAALHDPKHRGLICLEEPENGVHPARLPQLIEVLRSLVTDPSEEECDQPLSQLLLTSHSPVVLSCVKDEGGAVLTDLTGVVDPGRREVRHRTRMRTIVAKSGNGGGSMPRLRADWST